MRIGAFILVLALTAGAAAAEPVTPEAALDTPPAWIKKPTYEDLNAVWPAKALRQGIDGRAEMVCVVTPAGLLEACKVVSEKPEGVGFGESALLLAPSFVLKAGQRNGKPVSSEVHIPVVFKTEGGMSGIYLDKASMVTEPVWEEAPSFADMAAAWPERAKAEFGHVSMRCRFTPEGGLRRCEVLTETPLGQGFGRAALSKVAPLFRLRMSPEVAKAIEDAAINLPVRFTNPAVQAPRAIVKPKWITRPSDQAIIEAYPRAAEEAGVMTGRGVADCAVAPDGALTDCRPAPATPEGLGFSEAAVAVAARMRMNPWSDGGGPVDGVRLRLPISFNLKPEPVEPPKP